MLIFGILNLQESAFFKRNFKKWYMFCCIANLTIYILPFIIVEMFLKKKPQQFLTTILTGGYVALYLLPVCLVVFYKIKKLREVRMVVETKVFVI